MKFKEGPKNGDFFEGLVHGFCPKIELSLIAFFHESYVRKDRFSILWKEKNDFTRKKLKFKIGPKNGHFRKGLVHGFRPNIELSLIAVFHKNYVRKHCFSIFQIENNHSKIRK